ncbi:glycosyltransferase family 4 protein [bacterium]|nr:glycosyltransferase family 4 protein [bacterium]
MNILMITNGGFPPDIRIEKEAACLRRRHRIFILASDKTGRSVREETLEAVRVFRIAGGGGTIRSIPFFMNPFWLGEAIHLIRRYRIDRLHIHDLPLAFVGMAARWLFRMPVAIDLHENYPEALRLWGSKGRMSFLIRNPRLARIYERYALKLFDPILVVDENHKRLLIEHSSVPETKIAVVPNTVSWREFTQLAVDPKIVRRYDGKYVVAYVGNFGVERGLDIAVRGIPGIIPHIPNLRLLLIGDGPNRTELEALADSLGVRKHVEFTGWVDFHLVPSYLTASRICIIPQPGNALIDNGIPHKMFQYMALKKPILAADSRAITRVIRETGCGATFVSGSPESFTEALLSIRGGRSLYGENGRRAVREKYNWEKTSETLLQLYP